MEQGFYRTVPICCTGAALTGCSASEAEKREESANVALGNARTWLKQLKGDKAAEGESVSR